MATEEQPIDNLEPQALFAPQPLLQPCSWAECMRGHRWPPEVIVAKCSGCQGPMLATKQQACPFCNEPVLHLSFRMDIVPPGAGAPPRCKGAKPFGESLDLTIERRGHVEAMETWKDFEAKEAESGKKSSGTGNSGNLE